MKIAFDTNVLVAGLVQPHTMHERAIQWLKRAKTGKLEMIISSHTLAELYAVLTTLPVSPRITSSMAWRLIHENIEQHASIVALSTSDYKSIIRELRDLMLSGGVVYDAIILKSALKAGAKQLLTFNIADFRRIYLHKEIQLIEP